LTEREISRNAARRLAIIRHAQEVSGNVAFTCRYYGMARPSYYKWLRRYEELGEEGLRDRSRRPLVSPRMRPRPQWWTGSSTSGRTTTSARSKSRCTQFELGYPYLKAWNAIAGDR
jgi:transposase-like protein